MNSSSQNSTNAMNQAMSQEQMKFQQYMSNTAVQRRVEDMRKAGMNPVLSVGGASAGASTPQGAKAEIRATDHASAIAGIMNSITQAKLANSSAEKAQAETKSIETSTDRMKGLTPLEIQEKEGLIKKIDSSLMSDEVSRRFTQAQTIHEKAKIINTQLQREDILAGVDLKKKTGSNLINNDELINIQTEVAKLNLTNQQADQLVLQKARDLAIEKTQTEIDDAKMENGVGGQTIRYIEKRLNKLGGILGGLK